MMKSIDKKFWNQVAQFVGIASLNLVIAQGALASGFGAGNGGDTTDEARFMDISIGIERYLQTHPDALPEGIRAQISSRVYTLNLEFVENVATVPCAGTQKKACNYPEENRIVVARNEWQRMQAGSGRFDLNRLVAHELLGLAGSPDAGYALSGRLTSAYLEDQAQRASSVDLSDVRVLSVDRVSAQILIDGRIYRGFVARDELRLHTSGVLIGIEKRRARRACRGWAGFRQSIEAEAIAQCSLAMNPAGCRVVVSEGSHERHTCSASAIVVDVTEHGLN